MIFAIFQEVVKNTKKIQLLNFGRLPPGQFLLDFKKKSDLGYYYLYLQHILGATKSGKSDDPLGGLSVGEMKNEGPQAKILRTYLFLL